MFYFTWQIVSSIQQIFSKQFLVFSRYLANSFQYLADIQLIVSSIQQIFSKQFLVFSRYLANSFYLCGICLGLLANSFQQFLLSQEIVSGFYRNGKQRGQGTPQYIYIYKYICIRYRYTVYVKIGTDFDIMSGGQNYIAVDMAKVDGPQSVVKVSISVFS